MRVRAYRGEATNDGKKQKVVAGVGRSRRWCCGGGVRLRQREERRPVTDDASGALDRRPVGTARARTEGARRHDSVCAVGTVRVGEFEWDEAKARANVRKHGVTFEEAMTVFLDELAVPFEEGEDSDRLILVGVSQLG
jgi:hypothetical protein